MIALLGDAGALVTPLLISLAGSGGIIGALVAFAKLGGEKGTAAMSQAQGANEVLQETLAAVERERDYWRNQYHTCARRNTQLVEALGLRDRLEE